MKKIILVLALTFLFNINTSAASICDSNEQIELNQKAANIKVNYEILTEEKELPDGTLTTYSTKVSIYNVTKEFYVVVSNNTNNNKATYYFENAIDGVIIFTNVDLSNVVNYTIEVYTTNETGCMDERYKTLYVTTPRYNDYYNREICVENSEFDYCKQFVVVPEIDEDTFLEKLNKYVKKDTNSSIVEDENNTEENKTNFIDDYKWYIIGGVILAGAGIITINYLNRRKKQRDLGI